MKRYTVAVFSLMFAGSFGFGQTLPDAIKKTDNERYEEAAKDFRTLIAQGTPSVGDNYFFYGENLEFFKSTVDRINTNNIVIIAFKATEQKIKEISIITMRYVI